MSFCYKMSSWAGLVLLDHCPAESILTPLPPLSTHPVPL